MFLRNYDNFMAVSALPKIVGSEKLTDFPASAFADGSILLKSSDGQTGKVYDSGSTTTVLVPFSWVTASSGAINATQFVVGSGDAEVTYDDYHITNIATTTKTISLGTVTYDAETKKYTRRITYTLSFGGAQTTIKEYGFYYYVPNWKGGTTRKEVYFYREVLESPVVVEPNANVTFSFDISTDANSSKPQVTLNSIV